MSKLIQGYEVVIGFETHAQLSTQSKIFSRAATAFGAEPNTQACAVDLALPGTLPVMNKGAVERAIEFGLAVNATIAPRSIFARKNYFYPDLPKGYQISQFEIPVVQGGSVEFFWAKRRKACAWCAPTWKKTRASRCTKTSSAKGHRPEPRRHAAAGDRDRARHARQRRGRGLCERAAQDRDLDRHLRRQHAGGQFRCDANVSVRKPGPSWARAARSRT
jgi:aspartyl-tRNA(Asn)/glutamyl-tRNA(Gln) amidotransferase subunit B